MWCGRCASGIAQPTDGAKITVPRAVAALSLQRGKRILRHRLCTGPFRGIARLVLAIDAQILVVAEQLERRHLPVMHEAVPGQADLEARRAHAPVVVVVLEHAGTEALVERTDDLPHPAWHRDAEEREHRDLGETAAVLRAMRIRPGRHSCEIVVADRDLRLVADRVRHRTDEAEMRVPPQMPDQRSQPGAVHDRVVVEKAEIAAPCDRRALVVRCREALVVRIQHDAQARLALRELAQQVRRRVLRSVVHDDHLEVARSRCR